MSVSYHRHCVGNSRYHLQFTPKYRRKVFRNRKVRKLCEALLRKKAYELGVRIEALEFGPDHVHLFVTNCRKLSVPYLVQHFKGYSSWYIRRHAVWEIEPYLWTASFWSDGYFFESIGRVTEDTVIFYIQRQQAKHWMPSEYEPILHERDPSQGGQWTLDEFGTGRM